MVRNLSAEVVIYYSLRESDSISLTQLRKRRKEIISTIGDVQVDVSFVSLRNVVQTFDKFLELESTGDDFQIIRKHSGRKKKDASRKKGKSRCPCTEDCTCECSSSELFDESWQRNFLMSEFDDEDLTSISMILEGKQK